MLKTSWSLIICLIVTVGVSVCTTVLYAMDESAAVFRNVDPKVAECLSPGHKAASSGAFDEAAKIFSSCVEKYPDSAGGHFFLGMALFYKKDKDRAIDAFKKASQLEPNSLEPIIMLGRLYSLDKEKLSLARELLERALSAAPYKDDVRFDLARVYALSGEEQRSLKEFQTLFSREPNYGIYHTEFARILIAAGEKKAAISHLKRALALSPDLEPAKKLLQELDRP